MSIVACLHSSDISTSNREVLGRCTRLYCMTSCEFMYTSQHSTVCIWSRCYVRLWSVAVCTWMCSASRCTMVLDHVVTIDISKCEKGLQGRQYTLASTSVKGTLLSIRGLPNMPTVVDFLFFSDCPVLQCKSL